MPGFKRSRSISDIALGQVTPPPPKRTNSPAPARIPFTDDVPPAKPRRSRIRCPQKCSGGIFPTDTFQDVPINSVEASSLDETTWGVQQYRNLLASHLSYPSIGVSFEQYRTALRDPKTFRPPDANADRKPTFGPGALDIDFDNVPPRYPWRLYTHPVYKGTTSDPMIPLAIIRIAERNLPFINFDSALNNLPNLGAGEKYPVWRDDVDFIDKNTAHDRRSTHDRICVVFLPDYYIDGRHAVGFYTRKQPSKRFAAMLFTPCTVADLNAAKLWTLVAEDSAGPVDGSAWEDVLVGVGAGQWFHGEMVEENETRNAVVAVEKEWTLRLKLTLRELEEYKPEAAERDGGQCWDSWWE